MRNLPLLHRTRLSRTVIGACALAAASTLVLSACSQGDSGKDGKDGKDKVASLGDKNSASGASGGDKNTSEKAAGEKGDLVKYAGCMREHGIDMPDPDPGSGGMMHAMPAQGGPDAKKMEDASNACRKWLPNGGEVSEKDKAKFRENNLKMAECLREHGLNVPDPGPDGGMGFRLDAGTDPQKTDEAFKACSPGADGTAVKP